VLYGLYQTWNELLLNFPKSQRYTLGADCNTKILEILELVIMAGTIADKQVKRSKLKQASAKLDLLRLQVRLAKDCRCISNKQYLDVQKCIQEAGRMLGGWIKSLK